MLHKNTATPTRKKILSLIEYLAGTVLSKFMSLSIIMLLPGA